MLLESQEPAVVLPQLGQALIASNGPIGWLDKQGAELLAADTYLSDPPMPTSISRPSTTGTSHDNDGMRPDTAQAPQAPPSNDPQQALLEKYKDELETRTNRLMDLALSTVLTDVIQAMMEIRAAQPDNPLRYWVRVFNERDFFLTCTTQYRDI